MVCLDHREAAEALANDAVVRAGFDEVPLDRRCGDIVLRVADDRDAVVVALLNSIRKDNTLVVDYVNASRRDLAIVQRDEALHLRAESDADAATHHEHIMDDYRQAARAFDVKPTHLAGDDSVISHHYDVPWRRLRNDASLLKVGEVTILRDQVSFEVEHSDRIRFIRATSLEQAARDECRRVRQLVEARNLAQIKVVFLNEFY